MKETDAAQSEAECAAYYRNSDPKHARWARGYGAIVHSDET